MSKIQKDSAQLQSVTLTGFKLLFAAYLGLSIMMGKSAFLSNPNILYMIAICDAQIALNALKIRRVMMVLGVGRPLPLVTNGVRWRCYQHARWRAR